MVKPACLAGHVFPCVVHFKRQGAELTSIKVTTALASVTNSAELAWWRIYIYGYAVIWEWVEFVTKKGRYRSAMIIACFIISFQPSKPGNF